MHAPRIHSILCVVALGAYLLTLAIASGGVVLCQDAFGESTITIACDYAAAPVERDHDHEAGCCGCSMCRCEDTTIAVDSVPSLRDENLLTTDSGWHLAACVLGCQLTEMRSQDTWSVEPPPPTVMRLLRQLRTVRLLV